jgi:hypothetical protein
LGDTSLNLTQRSLNDTGVHEANLFVDTGMVVTRIVDEDDTHEAVQVIGVLAVNGNTSLILEGLTDPTLEKILVELGEE